ncbi:hypothetical protein, partial [Thermus sp.]|uniref:hypothetical protein n=1 Tax=Thermus sp. TaxID=275 RepID=UPI0026215A69
GQDPSRREAGPQGEGLGVPQDPPLPTLQGGPGVPEALEGWEGGMHHRSPLEPLQLEDPLP